jgi:hypothetical protein
MQYKEEEEKIPCLSVQTWSAKRKMKVLLEGRGIITVTIIHRPRVSDPDPYSIGPVDPDPESGSGSRRAKINHESRKKFVKVHVLKCWMASFES